MPLARVVYRTLRDIGIVLAIVAIVWWLGRPSVSYNLLVANQSGVSLHVEVFEGDQAVAREQVAYGQTAELPIWSGRETAQFDAVSFEIVATTVEEDPWGRLRLTGRQIRAAGWRVVVGEGGQMGPVSPPPVVDDDEEEDAEETPDGTADERESPLPPGDPQTPLDVLDEEELPEQPADGTDQ